MQGFQTALSGIKAASFSKHTRLLAFGILALIATGCGTYEPAVRSDFDRAVDFNSYKTFGFPPAAGTDRGGYATLITSHFKEAVRREMSVRGYTFVETNPDLLVNFYSETRDKTAVYPYANGSLTLGYGYGYRRFGYPRYGWYSAWPFYDRDIDVVSYTAGTLKLDVIDAKREQTVWEARVEERLTAQAQDNPQPNIARLVTAMFKKYPRGAASSAP
ncbi:MAG TPA: DUF4136 domain-containing protein [Steroidobacteraceae bacterium]|nr:DUF4136 domain-containing protein [Steroidobacteraceae bacterium]